MVIQLEMDFRPLIDPMVISMGLGFRKFARGFFLGELDCDFKLGGDK